MLHKKKRLVFALIAIISIVIFLWLWPKKIPVTMPLNEIYIQKMHHFARITGNFVGVPDIEIQAVRIDNVSNEYLTIQSLLRDIVYINCCHTIFRTTDTHGTLDEEIRIHWGNSESTSFDIFLFNNSSHIRINDTYYRLIWPFDLYSECENVIEAINNN